MGDSPRSQAYTRSLGSSSENSAQSTPINSSSDPKPYPLNSITTNPFLSLKLNQNKRGSKHEASSDLFYGSRKKHRVDSYNFDGGVVSYDCVQTNLASLHKRRFKKTFSICTKIDHRNRSKPSQNLQIGAEKRYSEIFNSSDESSKGLKRKMGQLVSNCVLSLEFLHLPSKKQKILEHIKYVYANSSSCYYGERESSFYLSDYGSVENDNENLSKKFSTDFFSTLDYNMSLDKDFFFGSSPYALYGLSIIFDGFCSFLHELDYVMALSIVSFTIYFKSKPSNHSLLLTTFMSLKRSKDLDIDLTMDKVTVTFDSMDLFQISIEEVDAENYVRIDPVHATLRRFLDAPSSCFIVHHMKFHRNSTTLSIVMNENNPGITYVNSRMTSSFSQSKAGANERCFPFDPGSNWNSTGRKWDFIGKCFISVLARFEIFGVPSVNLEDLQNDFKDNHVTWMQWFIAWILVSYVNMEVLQAFVFVEDVVGSFGKKAFNQWELSLKHLRKTVSSYAFHSSSLYVFDYMWFLSLLILLKNQMMMKHVLFLTSFITKECSFCRICFDFCTLEIFYGIDQEALFSSAHVNNDDFLNPQKIWVFCDTDQETLFSSAHVNNDYPLTLQNIKIFCDIDQEIFSSAHVIYENLNGYFSISYAHHLSFSMFLCQLGDQIYSKYGLLVLVSNDTLSGRHVMCRRLPSLYQSRTKSMESSSIFSFYCLHVIFKFGLISICRRSYLMCTYC